MAQGPGLGEGEHAGRAGPAVAGAPGVDRAAQRGRDAVEVVGAGEADLAGEQPGQRAGAAVVVERVDVVSGVGPSRAAGAGPAAARFNDIHRVVTNLAVLDLEGADRTLRIRSVHPGVTVEDVQAASGCELAVTGDVPESRVPTYEELVPIREVLDPRRLREREVPS